LLIACNNRHVDARHERHYGVALMLSIFEIAVVWAVANGSFRALNFTNGRLLSLLLDYACDLSLHSNKLWRSEYNFSQDLLKPFAAGSTSPLSGHLPLDGAFI
jgi:hypothetical protein